MRRIEIPMILAKLSEDGRKADGFVQETEGKHGHLD